jgi:uncharacterized protein YndB with AHSA1/START domain
MAIKTIKKSIVIKASKEAVWDSLFGAETYPIWTAEFSEGSTAETDWQEGSVVKFVDASKTGMIGIITENRQPDSMVITYDGFIMNDVIDTESEESKATKGTVESYKLTEEEGGTRLDISVEMHEKYYDMMDEAWDRALEKLKEIAEG